MRRDANSPAEACRAFALRKSKAPPEWDAMSSCIRSLALLSDCQREGRIVCGRRNAVAGLGRHRNGELTWRRRQILVRAVIVVVVEWRAGGGAQNCNKTNQREHQ